MFRRTFWFTAGAATGVWATLKTQHVLRSLSPESIAATAANRAIATGRRAVVFAKDVRAAMAEREDQLNDALGLTSQQEAAELPGQRVKLLLQQKTAAVTHHRSIDRKEDH
ncbi:hypothetical protein G5C51_03980 [Streptomyces sp. A7024]|uniref:Secreted protein n=1 Tax=Streptomyces coryli TaxID=1128680 RepID=A0A6G4TSV2_9ACTN|nr:DUF6167 family protein [Streptomyces coryli]NGN63065.1 hypothetical protein [Streptomyces coryli]